MSWRHWPWWFLPVLAAACGKTAEPRPQWTVVLATDAPVPQFGDRLLVEVLDEQGNTPPDCSTCQRQLGADDPRHWPISFGITADGPQYRVRVRLFRVALLGVNGVPSNSALIDRSVMLPPTSSDLRVAVELPMRCFGIATDLAGRRSCDPDTGALAPEKEATSKDDASLLQVGTWAPAASVPCTGATPDEMVCVPGGAFLLGDPNAIAPNAFQGLTTPEHVVQLSPFRIDKNELTVKDFTNLRVHHPALEEPTKKDSGAIAGGSFCTYGGDDPALPLNCVTKALAASICAGLGKRLPTEAEWEFAAGNGGRESTFPWGSDDDVCHYAVLGRADIDGPTLCRISAQGTLPAGPARGGGPLDLTTLGIHDLAGNLSEWVADTFMPYTGVCWNDAPSPLVDPMCTGLPTSAPQGIARGGNWLELPIAARVVFRAPFPASEPSPALGVRCASDGK